MIAPTFVMIESILSLRKCYQSNLLSLGFADGSAIRFWKFVFCYVLFDKGFWNNWIVFSISCYCLKASFAQFQDSSLGFLEKFMFLWNWFGGTGNFLDFLVGFLIWQSREFKIVHGLARIFMFFLVGFLIWRNREFKILHGLARIFMFF